MAEKSFPIDLKGVRFEVTVEYDVDDPAEWRRVSAKPENDDADFLGFIQASGMYPWFD